MVGPRLLLLAIALTGCSIDEGGLGASVDSSSDTHIDALQGDVLSDVLLDSSDDGGLDVIDGATGDVPKAIGGLQAWYRSDLGMTATDGGVTSWSDQSGAGDPNRNLIQPNPAKRPTLVSTDFAFNGLPSVSTTFGTPAYLMTGIWATPLAQPFTVFAVASAPTATDSWLFDSANGGEVTISTHGSTGHLHLFAGQYSADVAPSVVGPTYSLIAIFDSSSANSRLYVSQNTSQPGANIGASAPSPLIVGDAVNDATGAFAGWTLAELALYAGALSPASVVALNAYAKLRYQLPIGP